MIDVRIYPLTLAKILRHSMQFSGIEVAGVLIGRLARDVVEISDSDTGPQIGTTGHVKLARSVAPRIAEKIHRQGRSEYIVGWYHSHPGFGCFLSSIDIETQQRLQRMFSQCVALVVDPHDFIISGRPTDAEVKMFRVQDGEAVSLKYEMVLDEDKILRNFIDDMERGEEHYITSLDKLRLEFYEWNRKLEEKINEATEEIRAIHVELSRVSDILKQPKSIE
ncbi:MAG: Mov34/MPN/PAD-1 family protein [Candidatus Jordarchaeum sp.]|uniref:Mov34/MPN/PAD-1 family protein n=1 Tax=Candidatus Jordarchaeum sp. TaxID=2823881 RepID=UPI00404A011D